MTGLLVGTIGPGWSENAVCRKRRKWVVEIPRGSEVELHRRLPWYLRPTTAAGKQWTLLSTETDEEEDATMISKAESWERTFRYFLTQNSS